MAVVSERRLGAELFTPAIYEDNCQPHQDVYHAPQGDTKWITFPQSSHIYIYCNIVVPGSHLEALILYGIDEAPQELVSIFLSPQTEVLIQYLKITAGKPFLVSGKCVCLWWWYW